jgi:hypothetical protein
LTHQEAVCQQLTYIGIIRNRILTFKKALECGLYALAMAMATESEVTRPLDWSAGTLETRYFDALMELYTQYINCNDEGYILGGGDLADLIDRWNRRYKDTYNLYIDIEDDIQISSIRQSIRQKFVRDTKTILVRYYNNHWQACCHFGKEKDIARALWERSEAARHSATPSSVDIIHYQRPSYENSSASNTYDSATNAHSNISTPVDLAIDRLVNTLKRLVSGAEDPTLANGGRRVSDQSLCATIDMLPASLGPVAWTIPTEAGGSDNHIINAHKFEIDTEHEPALDTPSTVQNCEGNGLPCSLESCDMYYAHVEESVMSVFYKKFGPDSDLQSNVDKKPTCSPEKALLMKQAWR